MTVSEYLETVKTLMLTDALVENFQIVRERMTTNDGHLRVRMTFINGNLMEFSEYIQLIAGDIQVTTYSYHCTDPYGRLIVRWDNTPHFPDLDGFPHHRHIGYPEAVQAGQPMNIFKVFDEIKQLLK
jgi:hypothetical protein